MGGPARIATYVGVGMVLAGFALIFFAWDGATEQERIQGQFPFMLSGGLGGLGLVVTGMALLLVQTQRRITARRATEMDRLQAGLDRLGALLPGAGASGAVGRDDAPPAGAPPAGARPGREAAAPGGYAPRPRRPATPTTRPPGPGRQATDEWTGDDAPAAVRVEDEAAWAPPGRDDADAAAPSGADAEQEHVADALEGVRGVGPARRRRIAEHFGSSDRLRDASVDELAAVPGVSRALAERIRAHLRR